MHPASAECILPVFALPLALSPQWEALGHGLLMHCHAKTWMASARAWLLPARAFFTIVWYSIWLVPNPVVFQSTTAYTCLDIDTWLKHAGPCLVGRNVAGMLLRSKAMLSDWLELLAPLHKWHGLVCRSFVFLSSRRTTSMQGCVDSCQPWWHA